MNDFLMKLRAIVIHLNNKMFPYTKLSISLNSDLEAKQIHSGIVFSDWCDEV